MIPRGKKIQTPSRQLESSSMTHEEEEEMQHDISKLRDQVQQVSLAQKTIESKVGGLKKYVEAKMDGLKKFIEANMDCLKTSMEDLKIDLKTILTKFLQEMLTNGERVVKETHDENKRNVSNDFIDSNIGLKNHNVLKINMRKCDGKDPVTWILQMEQNFDLHNVKNTQKVHIPLYIWNPINFYGTTGFALIKILSLGQFLRKK